MSGELVNLRRFRKRKARQEKEEAAEANRIAFGRSKFGKTQTRDINRKAQKAHDDGRLESPESEREKPDR
ncbi:MAG: DUF4169 family protein [Pseudomonadota bacterium]